MKLSDITSSLLSNEIALPISPGDGVSLFTSSWSWHSEGEISANISNHVTGDIGGTSTGTLEGESSYGCGSGCNYSCSYSCTSHYDQPDEDYDETVAHTGWKAGQYCPIFTTRWSPFSGSVSEDSYCCSYGCGCSCDYSYSYHCGYFSAPNFSAYVSESTYNGSTSTSGGTSHSGGGHGSVPNSMIPSQSGGFGNPVSATGSGIAVPTSLANGEPDFASYAGVSVETYLPPLPAVATPEPAITGNVPGISPMPDGSAWGAGWSAFWDSIGTAGYDFGNHLSFGSLDEERYNAQVTASGEELYNTAINLGYSNESIASGIGLGQALAGEVVGTNSLSDAITGYDLGTNQSLSGMERLQEAAQGVSQVASTLAGGASVGAKISIGTLPKNLNYTSKVAEHMAEPSRFVPQAIIKDVIRHGKSVPDPRGSRAIMYYDTLWKNRKPYTIEVLYDWKTHTVWHVMYYH